MFGFSIQVYTYLWATSKRKRSRHKCFWQQKISQDLGQHVYGNVCRAVVHKSQNKPVTCTSRTPKKGKHPTSCSSTVLRACDSRFGCKVRECGCSPVFVSFRTDDHFSCARRLSELVPFFETLIRPDRLLDVSFPETPSQFTKFRFGDDAIVLDIGACGWLVPASLSSTLVHCSSPCWNESLFC